MHWTSYLRELNLAAAKIILIWHMPRLSTCLFHYIGFPKYIHCVLYYDEQYTCMFLCLYACVAPRPGLQGPEIKTFVCLFDSKVTSNLPVFWGDPPSEPWSVHQSHVCKLHLGLPVYYTGQKPINSPCISVNLRHSEEPWDNRISALLSWLHGIVTWRIYGVLMQWKIWIQILWVPSKPSLQSP